MISVHRLSFFEQNDRAQGIFYLQYLRLGTTGIQLGTQLGIDHTAS